MNTKLVCTAALVAAAFVVTPVQADGLLGALNNNHNNAPLVVVSPSVSADGNAILSGNKTSILNGVLNGNNVGIGILSGNQKDGGKGHGKKKRRH